MMEQTIQFPRHTARLCTPFPRCRVFHQQANEHGTNHAQATFCFSQLETFTLNPSEIGQHGNWLGSQEKNKLAKLDCISQSRLASFARRLHHLRSEPFGFPCGFPKTTRTAMQTSGTAQSYVQGSIGVLVREAGIFVLLSLSAQNHWEKQIKNKKLQSKKGEGQLDKFPHR